MIPAGAVCVLEQTTVDSKTLVRLIDEAHCRANIVNLSRTRHMFNCDLKSFVKERQRNPFLADTFVCFRKTFGKLVVVFAREANDIKFGSRKICQRLSSLFCDFDELQNEKQSARRMLEKNFFNAKLFPRPNAFGRSSSDKLI